MKLFFYISVLYYRPKVLFRESQISITLPVVVCVFVIIYVETRLNDLKTEIEIKTSG